jgi:Domain of unknown function (DUF4281)
MTRHQLFSIANPFAFIGWLVLGWSVIRRNNWLRDDFAGRWWPFTLAAVYSLLILLFFGKTDGGFDSLENVRRLFASDWLLLAGWVHYLAFDLFVGSHIAKRVMDDGLPRLTLLVLLPLTFLFGPMGFATYQISSLLLRKVERAS